MDFIYFVLQFFCQHQNLRWERNIYGDKINHAGGKRSQWKCLDCGAVVFKDKPCQEPERFFLCGARVPEKQPCPDCQSLGDFELLLALRASRGEGRNQIICEESCSISSPNFCLAMSCRLTANPTTNRVHPN